MLPTLIPHSSASAPMRARAAVSMPHHLNFGTAAVREWPAQAHIREDTAAAIIVQSMKNAPSGRKLIWREA